MKFVRTMMIREFKDTEDINQAVKLATLCFHEPTKEMEKFFAGIQELKMIGAFEENTLLAAAGAYKFQMFIRDTLFDCAGIAGVMTNPTERRKGYVKELMNKLIVDKKNQDYPVAALWPFNHSFYQKFGFGNAEKIISYHFKPSDIKSDFKLENDIKICDVTDEKDYLPLIQVAKNALNKYTRIIGDVDAWLLRGELQGYFKIYLIERDEKPVAYISLKFKKAKEWENNMQIMDFAYIDIQAKHSLFAFLRNFEADINQISLTLPVQEEIESYLDGVKDTHKFSQWPAMFRILDVKKAFEQLDYHSALNEKLYFQVEDNVLSENSGIWNLEINNGNCIASKIEGQNIAKEKILEFSINQLSQILIGYSKVEHILEHTGIRIPEEWKHKDLFPIMPCSFMLWF